MLRFTVRVTHADLLPPDNVLAEAGARGVSNLIVRHLRARPANRRGFPSGGYWADAAESVSVNPGSGRVAAVEIAKEGVALHYEGGTVLPVEGGKALATSKVIHVATKGGKVGNSKSVAVTNAAKGKLALKKGKSFTLKVKTTPQSKKLKVKKHRAVAFESSNKKVATVSKKGVVKAKKKGTCYVYAYAQNGACKAVKVTVK